MAVIRLMGAKIPADFYSDDGAAARARPLSAHEPERRPAGGE